MNEEMRKERGAKIREIREFAGMTQEEFGEEVGARGAYLSQVELGKRPPSIELIRRICLVGGVSPARFLKYLELELMEDFKEVD